MTDSTAKLSATVAASTKERSAEPWLGKLRLAAIACFVAIPIFSAFVQALAGRVVWTVTVAVLPLFIVLVGYHRWRRICPLAFIAQIPGYLKFPGQRKAAPWLEKNYYYVAFTVFFVSLWLRLIATNGDGLNIAIFFVLLSLAALTAGLIYTGKTWCNYFCPVSFIEKIYTEPYGLRETPNSQCSKCTACKKHCPDINEENAYWKEVESRSKRMVSFAFPGLVFAFYFYYYLQAGTWTYYFSTFLTNQNQTIQWVNQPGLLRTAFFPGTGPDTAGFFFLPQIPRALASLLTLIAGATAGFVLFRSVEGFIGRWLKQRTPEVDALGVRHTTLTLAAFTAFVTFYTFAAQPTLRKVEWLPHFFGLVVVFTATYSLMRRLTRTQKAFAEEALARNIIKRWKWADEKPPKDLREAFLVHTIRQRETARSYEQVLEAYNGAVRETLAEGFITRNEVHFLESLRNQLQIRPADNEKIMATLAEEERMRITDPAEQLSAEKRLQLDTYTNALSNYLTGSGAEDEAPDDAVVRQLRSEYRVTRKEHALALDTLLSGKGGAGKRFANELAAIEQTAKTITALEREHSQANDFLGLLLQRRRARAVDRLLRSSGFAPDDEAIRHVRDGLMGSDEERRAAVDEFSAQLPPAMSERLLTAYRETVAAEAAERPLTDRLRTLEDCVDYYIRAVVLYILNDRRALKRETLTRLAEDENEIVRDLALRLNRLQFAQDGRANGRLSVVEKMLALRTAPIFSALEPEELAELARSSTEEEYAPQAALCLEGTQGSEVFILLRGEVKVLRRDGASSIERSGSLIGEMAVLDPAPRAATVLAGPAGVSVLRLADTTLRDLVNRNPTIAYGVIRVLARRLRPAKSAAAGMT